MQSSDSQSLGKAPQPLAQQFNVDFPDPNEALTVLLCFMSSLSTLVLSGDVISLATYGAFDQAVEMGVPPERTEAILTKVAEAMRRDSFKNPMSSMF
jgi:hypothetical protein